MEWTICNTLDVTESRHLPILYDIKLGNLLSQVMRVAKWWDVNNGAFTSLQTTPVLCKILCTQHAMTGLKLMLCTILLTVISVNHLSLSLWPEICQIHQINVYQPHSEGCIVFSSVCLSVCQHDNSGTVKDIILRFSGHYPTVKRAEKFKNGYTTVSKWWFNVSDVMLNGLILLFRTWLKKLLQKASSLGLSWC